jgi:hypothetical protein
MEERRLITLIIFWIVMKTTSLLGFTPYCGE